MSSRIARRDRRNAQHGYDWTNPEAVHLRMVRARRAREWELRAGLASPWQTLRKAFVDATVAIRFAWNQMRRAFAALESPNALDDPNDAASYTLAGGAK